MKTDRPNVEYQKDIQGKDGGILLARMLRVLCYWYKGMGDQGRGHTYPFSGCSGVARGESFRLDVDIHFILSLNQIHLNYFNEAVYNVFCELYSIHRKFRGQVFYAITVYLLDTR